MLYFVFLNVWVDMVPFALLQLSGSIALSVRGECDFSTKAQIAESAGAIALLVINDKEGCNIQCTYICNLHCIIHL